ncbi:MAG: metal-dependent hydrolase family protein [Acidimicrobiales bacterium]
MSLRAARLLDVASGSYVDNKVVVVKNGLIELVADSAPDGCQVMDLGDRTLLPGLIDAHTHIFLHSNRMFQVRERTTTEYQLLEEYPAHRIARCVRAMRIALGHGFTTMRDLGTEGSNYDDVGLRDAVDEGVIPGPHMLVAGPALTSTGSYKIVHYRPDWPFPTAVMTATGPDECRKAIRIQASYGINWLKVYASSGYGTELTKDGYIDAPPNWTPEELQAIVEEAHARGLKVAAHATTITGTRMAINAGVESIEHAHTIPPDLAEVMAAKGIFAVPTLTTSINTAKGIAGPVPPIWAEIPRVQARSLQNCRAAGVKVAMGTDAGSGSIPWTHVNQVVELQNQVDLGLEPMESIRTATTTAAELLGLREVAGMIRPGFRADIVAVPGDPLSDVGVLSQIDFVMKDGEVFRQD